jgi:hypothetical protein
MSSEAQINANRLNSQKSTGPQSLEGKAAVSQNAVKHGLFASEAVVKGENRGDFDLFRDEMLAELAPVGPVESILAARVVSLSWRLKRAERIQNQAIDVMIARDGPSPLAKLAQSLLPKDQRQLSADASASNGDLVLGRAAIKDYSNSRVLDRLLMYERRIEHSMFKTMAELQRLRLIRELQEAAAEEEFAVDAGSPQNNEVNCAKQSQFEPAQMNVSSCARKEYENRAALRLGENKANTKIESRRRKAEDGEKSGVLSLRDENWNVFRSPSDFYLWNDAKQPGTNIR